MKAGFLNHQQYPPYVSRNVTVQSGFTAILQHSSQISNPGHGPGYSTRVSTSVREMNSIGRYIKFNVLVHEFVVLHRCCARMCFFYMASKGPHRASVLDGHNNTSRWLQDGWAMAPKKNWRHIFWTANFWKTTMVQYQVFYDIIMIYFFCGGFKNETIVI